MGVSPPRSILSLLSHQGATSSLTLRFSNIPVEFSDSHLGGDLNRGGLGLGGTDLNRGGLGLGGTEMSVLFSHPNGSGLVRPIG